MVVAAIWTGCCCGAAVAGCGGRRCNGWRWLAAARDLAGDLAGDCAGDTREGLSMGPLNGAAAMVA